MSGSNSAKIPSWSGIALTAFISFLGFWGMWSVARADVENLKKDVDALKPLATAVAVINNEIPNIKASVQDVRTAQMTMQTDVNEIKRILLQRNR